MERLFSLTEASRCSMAKPERALATKLKARMPTPLRSEHSPTSCSEGLGQGILSMFPELETTGQLC